MTKVNVRRPVGYLCVAAVLALGSLLLPGGGTSAAPGTASTAPVPPAPTLSAAPPAMPCTQPEDSLRPTGPMPLPGAMPSGSTMAKIFAIGKLRAGVDQGKYRVAYRDSSGDLQGSDIDIVHKIAAAIFGDQSQVQFVVLALNDRSGAIERGDVDVVVDDFTVCHERQQQVEFSTAYLAATQLVLVRKDSGVSEIEDLAGKQVCTSTNSTTVGVLRKLPIHPDVMLQPSIPECMVEFQRGHVAAISSDDVLLAGLAEQDPQTKIVGRSLNEIRYAVGMSPSKPDLVRFVNAVLERARSDGSLAASDQYWFKYVLSQVPQPAPARYRD